MKKINKEVKELLLISIAVFIAVTAFYKGVAIGKAIIAPSIFNASAIAAATTSTDTTEILYKSVLIKPGDSLWQIALEHNNSSLTTKEYVNELMKLNNLTSSKLTSGKYLIVFYLK